MVHLADFARLFRYVINYTLVFSTLSLSPCLAHPSVMVRSGGLLSDTQLVLDCWNMGDWTGITGNVAKFFLGFVSIFFDVIFMLQHYVLYPHHRTAIAAAVEPEEEGDKRDEGDEATNELLTV